jgi:LuxR family maltose regulon positive regulatory protein
MLIRVYLTQQAYGQAMNLLQRFSSKLDRPGDISTTIEFLALQVVTLYQRKKTAQAREVAARLLRLTEPNGHVRVYVDAGEPMKQVLESLRRSHRDDQAALHGTSASYICTLLTAFKQKKRMAVPPSQMPSAPSSQKSLILPPGATPPSEALVELLSRQEHQVLRMLAIGHSNPEIASLLVVSVNTVKTHVQQIYQKLGVHNRVQACEMARRLLLL